MLYEIVKRNYLSTDKSALKVAVYLSCRAGSLGALGDSPSAYLLRTCGKIADKSEERVACLDKSVKTALGNSEILKEERLFLGEKKKK